MADGRRPEEESRLCPVLPARAHVRRQPDAQLTRTCTNWGMSKEQSTRGGEQKQSTAAEQGRGGHVKGRHVRRVLVSPCGLS